jgi:aminoglycoside phosphotransferase (APT) family kinase protein
VPHIEREPFDLDEWISDLTGPAPLVARTLEDAPSALARELVLSHGDLGAEHLFTTGDHVTGLVDWGDAGVMDRAVDFARILRDFGPRVLEEALDAYVAASEVDRQAVTFFARCAALEDLGYAAATGKAAYRYAAQRSFGWLFPGAPALSTGLPGEASRWHNSQESC